MNNNLPILYSKIFNIFLKTLIGVELKNPIISYRKPFSAYIKLIASLAHKLINTFLLTSFTLSKLYLLLFSAVIFVTRPTAPLLLIIILPPLKKIKVRRFLLASVLLLLKKIKVKKYFFYLLNLKPPES